MRAATFNIQSGKSSVSALAAGIPADHAVESAAERIAALGVDVLALQEVSEPHGADDSTSVYRVLADRSGLPIRRFAPARRRHAAFLARLRGRANSGYGIALATRFDVLRWKVLRLPSWKSPIRRDPSGRRGFRGRYLRFEEQRMAIIAVLDAGSPVVVCATHLAPNSSLNSRQLAWLERRLERFARRRGLSDVPLVLLGDLNMGIVKVREESGLAVLAEGLTYPEDAPRTQIDHILGRGVRALGDATVVHLTIADHAGLSADLDCR